MKEYDDKQVQENIDKAIKTLLENNPFDCSKAPAFPEIYCRNCGRSVYVGRCCPAPDIQGLERPDPEIMKQATEFADATVVRKEGETYSSYFRRKVAARREKAEELKQGDVWYPPKGSDASRSQSCPPRGKEMTIDYAKVREGKTNMMVAFNEARERAEKEGTIQHIPFPDNPNEALPPLQMGILTRKMGPTPSQIRALLDAGVTIGLISYESELDMEKYRELSPESFDKVVDICNNPGEPSQALKDLMSRPRVAVKCGTGIGKTFNAPSVKKRIKLRKKKDGGI